MKKIFRIFLLTISLFLFVPFTLVKADSDEYVRDDYGLLSESEVEELNELAREVSEAHDVGVYVRVIGDYDQSSTIEMYNEKIFFEEGLGYGLNQEGVILLVAMGDRSYDLFAKYGGKTEEAFSDYAREEIASVVANNYLRNGEYYNAFESFINLADECLTMQEKGTPLSYENDPIAQEREELEAQRRRESSKTMKTGITFGVPPIVSLLICLGLRSRNKTAHINYKAGSYIPQDGIKLRTRDDIFINRTETRQRIHRDNDSGGGGMHSSHTSAGGHTSGHF
jgi:uncharacterized protein